MPIRVVVDGCCGPGQNIAWFMDNVTFPVQCAP
jgi:hypothetical protein